MPPNITRNQDVLRNSKIPSISSLMGTQFIRQITPENVAEICKAHSDENIGQTDLSQNPSELNEASNVADKILAQDVDYKRLLKSLFGSKNSVNPTSRICLTDLFKKFDAIDKLPSDEAKSDIINAIKRIGEADVLTKQESNHLLKDSIFQNINFKKLVDDHFSNYFGDDDVLLNALLKLIPEKKTELERVFQTKDTGSCDKLKATVESSEGSSDGVVDSNGSVNKMQKMLRKYSRKELIDVKKAMPDSCNDLSHISCDITLLTELKKGQYPRVLPFNPPKKFSGRRFKESSFKNGGQSKVSCNESKSSCNIECQMQTSAEVLLGDAELSSFKDKLSLICNSDTKVEDFDIDRTPKKELEIAPVAKQSEFAKNEMQISSDVKCREVPLINLSAEVSQGKVSNIQMEELQNIPIVKPSECIQDKVQEIVICDLSEMSQAKISVDTIENNVLAEDMLNLLNMNVASDKLEVVQANSSDITSSEIRNSCHFSSVDSSDIPSDSGKAEDENHLSLKYTNASTEYNSKKLGNGNVPFSSKKKSANIKNQARIPCDSATSFDSTSATKTKIDRSHAPKINLHRKAPNNQHLSSEFSSDDSNSDINQGLKVNQHKNRVQLNSVNSSKSAPKTTRDKSRCFNPTFYSQPQVSCFEDLIAQSQKMYQMAKVHTDYIYQLIQLNKSYQP